LRGISLGWPALKSAVQDEVRQQVKQPVTEAEASVKKQQVDIDYSLLKTDARLDQAQLDTSNLQRKLVDINDAIVKANQDALDLSDTVNSNADRLQDLGNKYASYGAVDTLTQQLSVLSNQVNSINKALNQLAQAVGKTNAVIDTQGVAEAVGAIQKKVKTFAAASDDDSRTTVYVQFAVSARSTRQEIVRLTDMLRKDGTFQIPGEERVATAEGKHEIRYFYQEDEPAVKELKADTEAALSDLGYEPVSMDPTPLLSFPGKPKRKVIELWLELPKKK
jgi:hypothetical protein